MTWFILIIILWLLAEGAVTNSGKNIVSQEQNPATSLVCKSGLILTLTLMVGFWGIVAKDHPEYVETYNSLRGYSLSNLFSNVTNFLAKQSIGMELGYNIINVLGNYLNLKAPLFFALIALFVNTCVIKFIYDYPHPILSLFFLVSMNFFLQEANLVRQILAMAIFLMSIKSLMEGKWKIYMLLIFIASLFHTSAIVLEIFVVFQFLKTKRTRNFASIALMGMWFVSILIMFGIVSLNFISIFSDSAYTVYAIDDNVVGMEISVLNIAFHNIIFLALLFCFKSLKVDSKLIYYAIITVTASTVNISYAFPNILRFTVYFSVAFFVFAIYLFSKSGKWKIGRQSIPILLLQIYCAVRILVFFILQDNIFGSESYSLTDFY